MDIGLVEMGDRDAKVGNLDLGIPRYQDVGRFEITVNQAGSSSVDMKSWARSKPDAMPRDSSERPIVVALFDSSIGFLKTVR